MSVYKKQGLFKLILETGLTETELTSATVKKIKYLKPSGIGGVWDATQDGSKLYYNFTNSTVDELGVWKFQSFAVINNLDIPGEIIEINFQDQIYYIP